MNGKKLKSLMKAHGISVRELAAQMGVTERQIYYLRADARKEYNWKPYIMYFKLLEQLK